MEAREWGLKSCVKVRHLISGTGRVIPLARLRGPFVVRSRR